MARCCAEGKCYCVLEEGPNVTITGNGTASAPYVIEANVTVEGGDFEISDLPPLMTFVRYDAIDGWPARPSIPVGWGVYCINEINSTPPPTGGAGGYISGLDVALLAVTPIP